MDIEQNMTRDETRALFATAGLTYDVLTRDSVQRLRNHINSRMQSSDLIDGTFRCRQRGIVRAENGKTRYAEIRCKSFYFEDRQAVTFNQDGFIGFAGWAGDKNIQPVLAGFADWVRETVAAGNCV
jgi:hypothetical protein